MSRTITVELRAEVSKFNAAMNRVATSSRRAGHAMAEAGRRFSREIQQSRRNMLTGPISDERREIQAIGRREMAEAIAWFRARNRGDE